MWGLISCHHKDPALVAYPVRTACDFIGTILSLQIDALESSSYSSRRSALQDIQAGLLARMAASVAGPTRRFTEGLLEAQADLLKLTGAAGAALVMGDELNLIGSTPERADVQAIVQWLTERLREEVFVTDQLAPVMPDAERLKDKASGLLAISVSQIHNSYVLWFRPEVLQTVTWGGDPRKRAELEPSDMRLHPRKSFEAWQETVRLHSSPWGRAEVDAANGLRTAIVDIVLRQAEELAAISDRLAASNRELEAFSYSVSHDLRAPFRHIVGYAQLLKKFEGENLSERGDRFIDTIIESAISAGTLVDDLLSFSQMGRATLVPVGVDLNKLVTEVRAGLRHEEQDRNVRWHIGELPGVQADPMMLKLAFQNLLENALKFSRRRDPAIIEIVGETEGDMARVSVHDNGAGFDMAYVGKLFGVFQRLHRVEEFEGTGIGLANVKRILERHGGSIWAEGRIDQGATFTITLPLRRS